MQKAVKSQKRVDLIESIIDDIRNHEKFDNNIKRTSPEKEIQKDIFQRLEKKSLKPIVQNYLGCSTKHAEEIVTTKFKWESDKNTTLNNFNRFGLNHRADATLEIDGFTIAIEIKKGNLKEGIGQSLLYSSVYDFIIFIYVDYTLDSSVKKSILGTEEEAIINKLWDAHNIKIKIV
jgi:hypothetical protein